ncbi:Diadenosine tetraphosphate (Ap4A) hydrolase [Streptomyces misionensis]|uniref:Diadenosine tetraphosphate (Ap4A) hydrolase n=1 Tax=Streptomyces misionensis TaxID=67331 RepID=A0A1H4IFC9_9ACTN|nr:HIT family protein [Streptomyces misionensis]SEB31972.1 Diadenosine tetraphosphate (Ap4A) hydrolase [Streptomyces misionensis]
MPDVFIDSFGARWQEPPPPRYRAAVLGINLTNALLNPSDDPALADIVARQTGHELTALRAAAHGRPVQLLVNCWYGRHRAPAIADAIGRRIREAGAHVQVTHHHINRPPVPRKHPRSDCPFCRIIHDGASATIVHEWSDALAIVPRSGGCTDGHLLVLPRGHVADFTTDPVVSATVQLRAAELAAQIGGQWNYLTSCGPDAAQTVFHLHGHLVPRTSGDGLALPWNHPNREQEAATAFMDPCPRMAQPPPAPRRRPLGADPSHPAGSPHARRLLTPPAPLCTAGQ